MPVPHPFEFHEKAVELARHASHRPTVAGRVMGKEYVRAIVAFVTNDLAVVRARHRL